jgi:hypothetical protein
VSKSGQSDAKPAQLPRLEKLIYLSLNTNQPPDLGLTKGEAVRIPSIPVERIKPRSPLRSGEYHIDLPAAALRTHQPLAPIEHGRFGAVPGSHLGGIGFDLIPAFLAPHDEPHAAAATPSVIGGPR